MNVTQKRLFSHRAECAPSCAPALYRREYEFYPPAATSRSGIYAPTRLTTEWPEEKVSFAEANGWYYEREMLFMNFRAGPVDLCCLGDSITQKFEWQDAFDGLRVANRGIGTDTVDGMLARLDSVEALRPKVISLLAGINDLGQGRTPEDVTALYRQLLTQLQGLLPRCQIIVNSILPVTDACAVSNETIVQTNTLLQQLCAEEGVAYVDVAPVLADAEGKLRAEYALDDVHLNPAGYAAWLSVLAPALEEALG